MDERPDQNFRGRVTDSFARQKVMGSIGAALTSVEYGVVEIEMPFRADLTQQHGFLHAGILSTALDSACGYAALSVMPEDAAVLTIEFKINLLSPGRGDHFLFRGEVTKPGNTIIVSDGRAYAISDGPAKLIASMTGTMMVVRGREGIDG
ncbi:PaaI family thioesterase [Hoeflea ulvae]|uniref:Medium/long-chain acyl-CoA thioesterase YigI n=1 Tax=Hoeflea ulvae TaxID=2983764 RepID=A0ABT3YAX3_9HYPH|nr:PaaI family thioesterase [Hoeflea ulvae]MCY0092910.1 PaaI family thioesterase [Hoeflea ulvae]